MSVTTTPFLSAFDNKYNSYIITLSERSSDVLLFLTSVRQHVLNVIHQEIESKGQIKFWLVLVVAYEPTVLDGDAPAPLPSYFSSQSAVCLNRTDAEEEVTKAFEQVFAHSEAHEQRGSGLVVDFIERLDIHVVKYKPLHGGSTYLELPIFIKNKHAVTNPQNFPDSKCFSWCVLAQLHPNANPYRVEQYKRYESDLNMKDIPFPVDVDHLKKFESQNPSISVNVYGYNDKAFFPLYHSRTANGNGSIKLLLYRGHYCLINNLNRLLGHERRSKRCLHFCPKCLFPLYNKEKYERHVEDCRNNKHCRVVLPSGPDATLCFKNHRRCIRLPVVVYADFEAFLEWLRHQQPDGSQPCTVKYQRHEPYSFGMVVAKSCCTNQSKFDGLKIYRGPNPVENLLNSLVVVANEYHAELRKHPLLLSADEERQFGASTHCHYCKELLSDDSVRDHCHYCGKFRGACHNACNQALQLSKNITVVFHNNRRYDTHIIMRRIGKFCRENGFKLNCVARGMEDYLTFSMRKFNEGWEIRFIDSFQFLSASLARLVELLPEDSFHAMKTHFRDERVFKLLLRKGVLHYDQIRSWSDLEKKELPKHKDGFYNLLMDEPVSDEDFLHAHTVMEALHLGDVGEYSDTYVTCDVLQTADVCEDLRKFGMETYGLDPFQYITMPSFSFDAALKLTKVKLQLLQCPITYDFIQRGIRGGISTITQRFAKSNNPFVKGYNDRCPTEYVMYWDVNNLYGGMMTKPLPVGEFQWVDEPSQFDIMSVDPEADFGYILEVDLHYPEALHDRHNDLPLAPEKITIEETMLSPYSKRLVQELSMKWRPSAKLAPNFFDKKKYVVHIAALQFYVKHGIQVTKVHKILKFRQSAWLKPYVELNTELRKQATSKLWKDLFKLAINSVYGKSMENVWLYIMVELVTSEQRFQKIVNKPTFQRAAIFDEDLAACCLQPNKVLLNKPIYTGLAILDYAKMHMYRLHYEHVMPTYGSNARLLLTDTDSFIYSICTPNIYRDMWMNRDLFDFSDYPLGHPMHNNDNKKRRGKLKDENCGEIMTEFTGLRSKMYAFKVRYGKDSKRAKGIKKAVVKKTLKYEDYLSALRNPKVRYDNMRMIRSYGHQLFSILVSKRSLSAFDDKRFITQNGICTFAHGHYKTLSE